MKATTSFQLLLLGCGLSSTNGFIQDLMNQISGTNPKPNLAQIVDAQPEQKLTVNLDIGKEGDQSRMVIQDMILGLHNVEPDYDHVPLPGKNGPHPNLSSGIRKVDLIQEGSFVSVLGKELVKTVNGCWEMCWKKDSPAGALVCGFDLPKEYVRNTAKLPQGKIYLSFPVWTKETLAWAQKEKKWVMDKAEEALQTRQEEMTKYQEERNFIKKALHYRNAYAAFEKYCMYPIERMKQVPESHEIIEMQEDLLLTTRGLVWSKNLPNGQQELLGSATVAPFAPVAPS